MNQDSIEDPHQGRSQNPGGNSNSTIAAADRAGRVALPKPHSLFRYAPALLLLVAGVADSMQSADADLWGHVRFGQVMLGTGHLIRADIFSY